MCSQFAADIAARPMSEQMCIRDRVVIGPSGSGKTTMLRCINFLERADAGTITVGDITVDAAKAKKKEIHEIRLRTEMCIRDSHYPTGI